MSTIENDANWTVPKVIVTQVRFRGRNLANVLSSLKQQRRTFFLPLLLNVPNDFFKIHGTSIKRFLLLLRRGHNLWFQTSPMIVSSCSSSSFLIADFFIFFAVQKCDGSINYKQEGILMKNRFVQRDSKSSIKNFAFSRWSYYVVRLRYERILLRIFSLENALGRTIVHI